MILRRLAVLPIGVGSNPAFMELFLLVSQNKIKYFAQTEYNLYQ